MKAIYCLTLNKFKWSNGGSVGIVTKLLARQPGVWSPAGERVFSTMVMGYCGPRKLLFSGYRQFLPGRGGGRSGLGVRLANHSPLSRAGVKKQWSCSSNLRFCVCGIHKENSAC